MNVSIGLIAMWLAFAMVTVGVKGRGVQGGGGGSDAFNPISIGATFIALLRGRWPYGVNLVTGWDNLPGTITTGPGGKQWIVPVDPNAPTIPVTPPASYPTKPGSSGATV